ncbi:unnamed protein product [Brassica napus]|uniref:(rape) hypothetical protein n=1 Tax=Brassica napus TaxID=3708 RepID=A0A816JJR2_BRANA|nr:unnamed protein product [Brassica napus]
MQSFGSQLWDTVFAVQALLASDLCDETYEVLRRGHKYIKISQCCMLLSTMPADVTGQKIDPEHLFDSVNLLLSLHREYVECTSSIIQAFVMFKQLYPDYMTKEFTKSIEIAVQFIESKQMLDGSWCGNWGICFIYGTWFALSRLAAIDKTYNNCLSTRRGIDFLLSVQNEDGGWGKSYLSCPEQRYIPLEGGGSNLVQTSCAMVGLIHAGQAKRDVMPLHNAAKFIIRNSRSIHEYMHATLCYIPKHLPIMGVGVENGCDVQIPEEENRPASIPLGRYVATELEPKLARAEVRLLRSDQALFQNIDTTLVHAFSSTLRCYLPKTVASPFHVPRYSKLSIKLYRKNRGEFVLYRKKP